MKYVPAYTFLPRLAAAAMMGSVLGLAGCDMGGSSKMQSAPPEKIEGFDISKNQSKDAPPPTITPDNYNEQVRKEAEERQKNPYGNYPVSKKK
jgi:hypothetical protein